VEKKRRIKLTCIALCAVFAVPLTKKWFFVFFNFKKIKENCFSILKSRMRLLSPSKPSLPTLNGDYTEST
jgi:hypothetical protein